MGAPGDFRLTEAERDELLATIGNAAAQTPNEMPEDYVSLQLRLHLQDASCTLARFDANDGDIDGEVLRVSFGVLYELNSWFPHVPKAFYEGTS